MAQVEAVKAQVPRPLATVVASDPVETRGVYGAFPSEASETVSLEPVPLRSVLALKPVSWLPGSGGAGTTWWYGDGPPDAGIPAVSGDLYYDVLTGDTYAFS